MSKLACMAMGLAGSVAVSAAPANAACEDHGQYAYGGIYYLGNAFTSASGIPTTDHIDVVIYVNKCLMKNHKYLLQNTTEIKGVAAQAAQQPNQNPFWSVGRGQPGVTVTGYFITDGAANPSVWYMDFRQSTPSAVEIYTYNTVDGVLDEGSGPLPGGGSGVGFNNGPPGSWTKF